jgi:oligosaccharide repeat unit polymerase
VRTKRAKVILIILIAAVVVFTLARGNSLLFEAYTYAAVPVPLLAHWATFVESSGTQTFGGSFLYGILTLLFRLSEIVGSPIGSDVSAAVALPQDHWVELLPGRPFNAFVTMFYYFFLDFRWAGVAVGGLAWGLLGQISYMRMWTSGLRATLFGLLMLQVAIMAFVRWEFSNGSFVIGLAMLLFFVKSGSVRSENPLSSPIESAGRRA